MCILACLFACLVVMFIFHAPSYHFQSRWTFCWSCRCSFRLGRGCLCLLKAYISCWIFYASLSHTRYISTLFNWPFTINILKLLHNQYKWASNRFDSMTHLQWVLSPKYFNFPFPITLTMIHMGFSGVVAFLLVRVFKVCSHSPVKSLFSIHITFSREVH